MEVGSARGRVRDEEDATGADRDLQEYHSDFDLSPERSGRSLQVLL